MRRNTPHSLVRGNNWLIYETMLQRGKQIFGPDFHMSWPYFLDLRPYYVKDATRETCMCVYHLRFEEMADGLLSYRRTLRREKVSKCSCHTYQRTRGNFVWGCFVHVGVPARRCWVTTRVTTQEIIRMVRTIPWTILIAFSRGVTIVRIFESCATEVRALCATRRCVVLYHKQGNFEGEVRELRKRSRTLQMMGLRRLGRTLCQGSFHFQSSRRSSLSIGPNLLSITTTQNGMTMTSLA